MNGLIVAIYKHFLIFGDKGPPWVVEGHSFNRFSSNKGNILSTDFVSIDGKNYHLKYDCGFRPNGYVIPLELFLKDEAEAQ